MTKVPGGYYIKARKIKGSAIAHCPPYVRELWDYLLREANHTETQYNGFTLKRGQLFRSYKEIREDLCWYVGYRKEKYNENHMKMGMRYLMKQLMITSTKQPRGNIITILNYDYYQDPKNYDTTKEATNDTTNGQPMSNQGVPSINKNVKNEKKKYIVDSDESTGEEIYYTYKKRKLSGKRLESFKRFWEAFNYKDGKAKAADSWFDIPKLTESFVDEIVSAAKAEAARRPGLISSGKTPKMAQGWITERRWEDETYKKEPGRKPQPSLQEQIS